MRENNRKPIEKCIKKLPQFTTMNVIDGQAGLVIYSSLIFYSLTIDNILNIIVLLILAGVSIAMLTGENGILNKATTAKQKTEQGTAEERVKLEVGGSFGEDGKLDTDLLNENLRKNIDGLTYNGKAITEKGVAEENRIDSLPATVELDGYEIIINENGSASTIIRMAEYQTEDTKPYLPGNDFSQVSGTTLDNGLVVTDGTNYWTWIEVPKTKVFASDTTEDNLDKIEDDLEAYTGALLSRNGYTDQWYDGQGKTESETTNPNDTSGCGLTAQQYKDLKETMLSSVYKNGGFWIGQYEAGADTYPATANNDTRTPVIAQGKYPYNYITCANAQIKSSQLNSGNYTSSLMFGIQWNLVLKHLQVRGKMTADDLTNDSTNWGNYSNATFEIEDVNAKYTTSPYTANSFKSYTEDTSGYVEENTKLNKGVLLTTGANGRRNSKMNIYDIAGNEYEWTLEKSTRANIPCTVRGGYYTAFGSNIPASDRFYDSATYSNKNISFRPALY